MKRLINFIVIGLFSTFIYCSVEIIWRGWTHWTMAVLAFIVGIILSIINDEILEFEDWYEDQVAFGTVVAVIFEALFGLVFNQNFEIWDYRGLWGTFLGGQLNIIFCGAWALIVAFGLPMLDWLQYFLGEGPKPYYRSWLITKIGEKLRRP